MNSPPGSTAAPAGIDEGAIYRTLFAAYPDALIVADALGTIVFANPAASKLLGYTLDELVGMAVEALVPDSARSRHVAHREAYGANPQTRPMGSQLELAARRRDGTEVTVEIALSPLQDHGLPLVVVAIRDVGSYPRVKLALQRAHYSETLARLGRIMVDSRDPQMLLRQVPAIAAEALGLDTALIFLLEPDHVHFRVASGVGLLAGETAGSLVANRPDTPPGFVLAEGKSATVLDYRSEPRFKVPQAYIDAGLSSGLAVPLFDRGTIIGVLTLRSRPPRRFVDDEVRFLESLANLLAASLQRARSEEALRHSQRLDSIGQLTGGIAHDFNNLLTVIQGNLQVLEELPALRLDAQGLKLVAAAARASKRGAELTRNLLAFSRRQVLQPSAVDLGMMLRSLADMLRRTLDQRIQIEVDAAPGCPPVQADPVQLESALLNIAINARDAMPEGGKLRFRAQACSALPSSVRNALDDPSADGFVAISIDDTGTGMPDEVKARAFEPFFTTKEDGRGTGLGLSTVYGFVKQSKGAISIDSTRGAGTTLTLYLPQPWLVAAPGAAEPHARQAVPVGLSVLLVEDDVEVRTVARSFLAALRCKVAVAASGEQALLALAAQGQDENFDLLLTDVALGAGMRGTELAARVQQRWPALAILLMSGFSAELLEADHDPPPSWELLRKPFTREELAQAIARAVDSR